MKVSFEVVHIALHGHDDCNFMQLFKLHDMENPDLNTWLKNKCDLLFESVNPKRVAGGDVAVYTVVNC